MDRRSARMPCSLPAISITITLQIKKTFWNGGRGGVGMAR
jgi:hypothetical protein